MHARGSPNKSEAGGGGSGGSGVVSVLPTPLPAAIGADMLSPDRRGLTRASKEELETLSPAELVAIIDGLVTLICGRADTAAGCSANASGSTVNGVSTSSNVSGLADTSLPPCGRAGGGGLPSIVRTCRGGAAPDSPGHFSLSGSTGPGRDSNAATMLPGDSDSPRQPLPPSPPARAAPIAAAPVAPVDVVAVPLRSASSPPLPPPAAPAAAAPAMTPLDADSRPPAPVPAREAKRGSGSGVISHSGGARQPRGDSPPGAAIDLRDSGENAPSRIMSVMSMISMQSCALSDTNTGLLTPLESSCPRARPQPPAVRGAHTARPRRPTATADDRSVTPKGSSSGPANGSGSDGVGGNGSKSAATAAAAAIASSRASQPRNSVAAAAQSIAYMTSPASSVTGASTSDSLIGARYHVVRELGRGACGTVLLMRDTVEGRLVAVKQVARTDLQKKRIGGPSAQQQRYKAFLGEIAIMQRLHHPNIVALYDVIDDPNADKLYLVMQYVDGGVIGTVVVRDGTDAVCEPVPPLALAGYVRQMLAGLEYLHRHNVVHRDIKPENILLSSEGHVYLADFGVAETLEGNYRKKIEKLMAHSMAQSMAMSVAGTSAGGPLVLGTKGTMLFIAPELWRNEKSYGKQVDMWAMGVTIFILLTGRLPFRNLEEITDPSLPVIPTEYGPGWTQLLRGMLERQPAQRLTAQEAVNIIANC